jgi:tRNA U34 5-methylaminomethyl-2-thiouridine-forming methyltransferase MnmC
MHKNMKQAPFFLKKTADGSDTLFSPEMEESYHSVNGAAQESRHVFIEAGLRHIVGKEHLRIFEVGFGTGLNALLTWGEAVRSNLRIDYEAIEAFPLSKILAESLNYKDFEPDLPTDAFLRLHAAPWDTPTTLERDKFSLFKLRGDFTTFELSGRYDLVYFDAFAPDKQPGMWEESLFRKIYLALENSGILVTYCAKGEVRRRLQRAGFKVERIPGPPGKREMLRATKTED